LSSTNPLPVFFRFALTKEKTGDTLSANTNLLEECNMAMEKVDYLVKGIPNQILSMFRGFCSIYGKTESEGVIDLMIEYIEKNTSGDKANFKKIVDEYRGSAGKKGKK